MGLTVYYLYPSRFREVGDDNFVLDNAFKQEDGSYVFPNITAADSAYASGDGVQYYCTATNAFGTIRSRTVTAFYAGECERERETHRLGGGPSQDLGMSPYLPKSCQLCL